MLNNSGLKASEGRLENSKKRHNIVQKADVYEAGLVYLDIVKEWINHTLPTLLHEYSIDSIINVHERLYFLKHYLKKVCNIQH